MQLSVLIISLAVVLGANATYLQCNTACTGEGSDAATRRICGSLGLNIVSCTFQFGPWCDVGDLNSSDSHGFSGQCLDRQGHVCSGITNSVDHCGG